VSCRDPVAVGYAVAVPADASLISVTAKVAAYYRQFSDIPFAQEIAKLIGADAAYEQILREHDLDRDKLTFYAPMFEARYKSLTQLIHQSGAPQVLELASGYSLRGVDLTRGHAVRYVETDLPAVVAAKRSLLDDIRQQHGIPPSPRHAVTAANALDFDQVRAAAAVLDRGQPVAVLCEGLIMYLSKTETEQLATNIHRLIGEFAGGVWITPDFNFRVEARDLPPERVRLREAIMGLTQRQMDASAFEDQDALTAFLGRVGFDVEVRSQIDETPSLSSIQALALPPSSVERLRTALRVWVMSLLALVLTLALGAGCGGGAAAGRPGGSAGMAGHAGAGGRADGGQGGGPGISLDTLCTAYTNDLCVYLTQCETTPYKDVAQCLAETDCLGVATLIKDVAAGAVGYDATAAAACQAKFLADPCHFGSFLFTPDVFQVLSDCPGTLTPKRAAGDPCADTSECLDGNFCGKTNGACPGTCKPYQPVGASCGAGAPCVPGANCYRGTCRSGYPKPGDPCTTAADCLDPIVICLNDPSCTPSQNTIWCDVNGTKTCQAGVGAGAACGLISNDAGTPTTVVCGANLWCDAFPNQAGTCHAFGGAGTPCNEYGCATGFQCFGYPGDGPSPALGTCQPPVGAGQMCTLYADCAAGLGCPSGTCVPPTGLNGVCDIDSDCQSGLFCSGNVCLNARYPGDSCADATSACVFGVCKSGVCVDHTKAGQPCTASADCISGTCTNGVCFDRSVCPN
jgi:O-methyltransferase involved in polyketide biosynthesis